MALWEMAAKLRVDEVTKSLFFSLKLELYTVWCLYQKTGQRVNQSIPAIRYFNTIAKTIASSGLIRLVSNYKRHLITTDTPVISFKYDRLQGNLLILYRKKEAQSFTSNF